MKTFRVYIWDTKQPALAIPKREYRANNMLEAVSAATNHLPTSQEIFRVEFIPEYKG